MVTIADPKWIKGMATKGKYTPREKEMIRELTGDLIKTGGKFNLSTRIMTKMLIPFKFDPYVKRILKIGEEAQKKAKKKLGKVT